MKRKLQLYLAFILCAAALPAAAQSSDELANRLSHIAAGSEALWGVRFEPNVAIVYPAVGQMVLCRRTGNAIACDSIVWDRNIPAANSTAEYQGVRYLTIVGDWIANAASDAKTELTAHEAFHVYQDSLGIPTVTSKNSHLDTPEGRALLHMEFEALRKAIHGDLRALREALCIRNIRRRMFPTNNEAPFELHEGLAQYTGLRIARTSDKDMLQCVSDALLYDIDRGYTNSFAYATGPAYALLLDHHMPHWRLGVKQAAGLSELLAQAIPGARTRTFRPGKKHYAHLLHAERQSWVDPAQYQTWLSGNAAVLRIPNNGIGIVFNPNDRITPIGDQAVLLRNVTLKGAWGTLTARQGVVRRNDWTEFLLAAPESVSGSKATGPEYRLDLTPGWEIVRNGNGWILTQSVR